jgi:hypothetical protein
MAVVPSPQACSTLNNDFSHTSNSNHTLSRTGEIRSLDPDWIEKQDSSHGLFVCVSAFVLLSNVFSAFRFVSFFSALVHFCFVFIRIGALEFLFLLKLAPLVMAGCESVFSLP